MDGAAATGVRVPVTATGGARRQYFTRTSSRNERGGRKLN